MVAEAELVAVEPVVASTRQSGLAVVASFVVAAAVAVGPLDRKRELGVEEQRLVAAVNSAIAVETLGLDLPVAQEALAGRRSEERMEVGLKEPVGYKLEEALGRCMVALAA